MIAAVMFFGIFIGTMVYVSIRGGRIAAEREQQR
jgi:hypothetical protein